MPDIQYSKNMRWSKVYVDSAKDLFNHSKVRRIRGYKVSPLHQPAQDASCISKGNRYDVHVCLNYGTEQRMLEDVLFALAHELAHTVHWDHTSKHLILTAEILRQFALVTIAEQVPDTQLRLVSDHRRLRLR